MKVKIGNVIYTAENEAIMLILSAQDKVNINAMLPEATKYCSFDDNMYSKEQIKEFMKT